MKKYLFIITYILISIYSTVILAEDDFMLQQIGSNSGASFVGGSMALDPAPLFRSEYGISFGSVYGFPLIANISLDLPVALISKMDAVKITPAILSEVFKIAFFSLNTKFSFENSYLNTEFSNLLLFSTKFALLPKLNFSSWSTGLGLEYRKGWFGKLEHNALMKSQNIGVIDGWFSGGASYFDISLLFQINLFSSFVLDIDAGYRLPLDSSSYSPFLVPYLLNISLFYLF